MPVKETVHKHQKVDLYKHSHGKLKPQAFWPRSVFQKPLLIFGWFVAELAAHNHLQLVPGLRSHKCSVTASQALFKSTDSPSLFLLAASLLCTDSTEWYSCVCVCAF